MKTLKFQAETNDDKIESLQRKLYELTQQVQGLQTRGPEFRHISFMLDETVAMLREALVKARRANGHTPESRPQKAIH